MTKISARLIEIIDSLPLKRGMRIFEIGCGPGVAAREIVKRVENGYVLAIDRSSKAIELAKKNSKDEIAKGKLRFIEAKIEEFELPKTEKPFDIALAVRVGAFDGRHPEIEREALRRVAKALKKGGKFFIDEERGLKEIKVIDI